MLRLLLISSCWLAEEIVPFLVTNTPNTVLKFDSPVFRLEIVATTLYRVEQVFK